MNNTNSNINLVKKGIADSGYSNHYTIINTDISTMQASNNTIITALLNSDLIVSTHIADFHLMSPFFSYKK